MITDTRKGVVVMGVYGNSFPVASNFIIKEKSSVECEGLKQVLGI